MNKNQLCEIITNQNLMTMKLSVFILFAILSFPRISFAQPWSPAQIDSAHTEKSNPNLSEFEKEAILIINLCRLYPKQFASYEVEKYWNGSFPADETFKKYKESLIQDLNSREPCEVLKLDKELYDISNCFAMEIEKNENPNHNRTNCPQPKCTAECMSLGRQSGFDVVMSLLIDAGIENHIHRNIVLDPKYTKIGLRLYGHIKYKFSAILDFC